jgi:hypothetical protein
MENGKMLPEALTMIADGSPPYLRWHAEIIKKRINSFGEDAIRAFDTGLFSRPILDRLDDAARSKGLIQALTSLGDRSLDSIVRIVKLNAHIVNSIGLVVVGLFFAYSVAVQLIGVQNASDRYMSSISSSVPR